MATSDDIDLELIAAFIDGRLGSAERDRVVRLLDESEAAFEIYTDALRARADLEPDSVIPLPVRPEPRRRRWWLTGIPAAAAAALVIAVLPAVQARRAGAAMSMPSQRITRSLTIQSVSASLGTRPLAGEAAFANALGAASEERYWSTTRGGAQALFDSTSALRLGVRATHLQATIAMGDRAHAERLAGEMVELLGSVKLSDAESAEYAHIRKRIASGDSLRQIADEASRAEQNLNGFLDSRWFGLGKWFAACELAARAHSADFFKSAETTRFLDAAVDHGKLAPNDVEKLRQVAVLARRGVADDEFEGIREKFAELIQRYGD